MALLKNKIEISFVSADDFQQLDDVGVTEFGQETGFACSRPWQEAKQQRHNTKPTLNATLLPLRLSELLDSNIVLLDRRRPRALLRTVEPRLLKDLLLPHNRLPYLIYNSIGALANLIDNLVFLHR